MVSKVSKSQESWSLLQPRSLRGEDCQSNMQKNGLQPSISFYVMSGYYSRLSVASNYVNLLKVTALVICFVCIKTSFPCSTIDYSCQRQAQTYAKQGLSKLLSFLQRERQNSNLTILNLLESKVNVKKDNFANAEDVLCVSRLLHCLGLMFLPRVYLAGILQLQFQQSP